MLFFYSNFSKKHFTFNSLQTYLSIFIMDFHGSRPGESKGCAFYIFLDIGISVLLYKINSLSKLLKIPPSFLLVLIKSHYTFKSLSHLDFILG